MRWAAMLRGVNLGKRTLRKEELIAAAQSLDYTGAQTLLASGNLVFDSGNSEAVAIERDLHDAVARLSGIKAAVIVRNAEQLEQVIAGNPFPDVAREKPGFLLVMFHRDPFPAELLDRLAEQYDGPERLSAIGRELFIDFPRGQGESKLVPAMVKLTFPRLATGRNWNTVIKLARMLE